MKIFDWRGLISAFQTITAIPVPGRGCENAEDSFVWFPWVGFALGAAAWTAAFLAGLAPVPEELRVFWILITAVLIAALWALMTRGFHLDGLADMCDGFGGGWTKERVLEIMRDSRIGSFGVIALILGLLLKSTAAAMLLAGGHGAGLLLAPVLARLVMVYQASFNVYARRGAAKVSMANHFIDKAGGRQFAGACFHAAAALGLVIAVWRLPLIPVLETAVAAFLTMFTVGYISRRKIGGVTGDILGATCELAETAALTAAALCL